MEGRRTSMRLREPAAKVKEAESKSENQQSPPKSRPVGRPKGSKKTKTVTEKDISYTAAVEKQIELKPTVITLPNKIVDGQALPSLPTLQSRKLKDADWQSVADSGVLVASLPRSRQRWLHEGMFETYWSKSTYKKKKEQLQQEGIKGPLVKEARPNMTKIGTCKMVVEPHIFDVTLFVIKDTTAPVPHMQPDRQHTPHTQIGAAAQKIQQHHHHMPTQAKPFVPGTSKQLYPAPTAGPPQHMVNQPTYGPPTTNGTAAPLRMQSAHGYHPPAAQLRAVSNAAPYSQQSTVTNTNTPSTQPTMSINPPQAHPVPAPSATTKPGPSNPTIRSNPASKPPPTQSGAPDPVIQMLAQRAQNDHALKQVMKLVAGGQATQAQLNYFQSHIDELTKLVKQRQEDERRKKAQDNKQYSQAGTSKANAIHIHPHGPAQSGSSAAPSNAARSSIQQQPYQNPRPIYHQPSVPVQPRPPRPVHVPPPLHVLLEFSQNSADRFLFPKHSILEFDAKGTSVLASFLVIKTLSQLQNTGNADTKRSKKAEAKAKAKAEAEGAGTPASESGVPPAAVSATGQPSSAGTTTTAGGAKPSLKTENAEKADDAGKLAKVAPEKQFYQPVSVRFDSPSDLAVLTALRRVVAPVEQVQKYMLDVASKAERVPVSYLAMRLPREPKDIIL